MGLAQEKYFAGAGSKPAVVIGTLEQGGPCESGLSGCVGVPGAVANTAPGQQERKSSSTLFSSALSVCAILLPTWAPIALSCPVLPCPVLPCPTHPGYLYPTRPAAAATLHTSLIKQLGGFGLGVLGSSRPDRGKTAGGAASLVFAGGPKRGWSPAWSTSTCTRVHALALRTRTLRYFAPSTPHTASLGRGDCGLCTSHRHQARWHRVRSTYYRYSAGTEDKLSVSTQHQTQPW